MTLLALLYADDLALVSTSMAGLQAQMDVLRDYALCWGLAVNVGKTKAVIYRAVRAPVCSNPTLMYDGKSIEFVESFKYLGIDLHCTQSFSDAGLPRKESGQRALPAMLRRCRELGITDCNKMVGNSPCDTRNTPLPGQVASMVSMRGPEQLLREDSGSIPGWGCDLHRSICSRRVAKCLRRLAGVVCMAINGVSALRTQPERQEAGKPCLASRNAEDVVAWGESCVTKWWEIPHVTLEIPLYPARLLH